MSECISGGMSELQPELGFELEKSQYQLSLKTVTAKSHIHPSISKEDAMETGTFNMRTDLGACRTYGGGSSTNKSAQELTRRMGAWEGWGGGGGKQKVSLALPYPARGSNPESI